MPHRTIVSLAAVTILATLWVATDALAAARGGARAGGGGAGRANVNRNVNVNRRVGYGGAAVVGAAAVGAAAYSATTVCGYFPYPPCY